MWEPYSLITVLGIVVARAGKCVEYADADGEMTAKFAIKVKPGPKAAWERYCVLAKGSQARILQLQNLSENMAVVVNGVPVQTKHEIKDTGDIQLYFTIEDATVQIVDHATEPLKPISGTLHDDKQPARPDTEQHKQPLPQRQQFSNNQTRAPRVLNESISELPFP